MRTSLLLLGLSLLLLLSGCGSSIASVTPAVQPASAQVDSPTVEVLELGQWEGSFPGRPGDGVGVHLTQVGEQILGSGIVVFNGDLVPVDVTGYTGDATSEVLLQLFPKDHGTATDTFFLTATLANASPANFSDSVSNETIAFTFQRNEQDPSEVKARLWDGNLEINPDSPEVYLLRVPGRGDTTITLETPLLVAIFGSWETPRRPGFLDLSPFSARNGDVRAYTFDFSPINNIVFTTAFSETNPFPAVKGEIFYNREIAKKGQVGSVYQLNSDSYRVRNRESGPTLEPLEGATLELVSRGD